MSSLSIAQTIPGPLLDRMEVIQLSGYDMPEKFEITRRYLEPKAREDTGLIIGNENVPDEVEITDGAVNDLIRWYCRESGVRNLQKQIQKISEQDHIQRIKQWMETKEKRIVVCALVMKRSNLYVLCVDIN